MTYVSIKEVVIQLGSLKFEGGSDPELRAVGAPPRTSKVDAKIGHVIILRVFEGIKIVRTTHVLLLTSGVRTYLYCSL